MQVPSGRIFPRLLVATYLVTQTYGYTFNTPGNSLVSYSIPLDISSQKADDDDRLTNDRKELDPHYSADPEHVSPSNVTVTLRYRTWQANALLLTGSLVLADNKLLDDVGNDQDTGRLVLQLRVLIRDGKLCVSVADGGDWVTPGNDSVWGNNEEKDEGYSVSEANNEEGACTEIQEGVNDNGWQSVVLCFNKTSVRVSSQTSERSHDHIFNIFPVKSNMMTLNMDLPGDAGNDWFVGCMDLFSVSRSDNTQQEDIRSYLTSSQDVLEGCVDLCVAENQCLNDGQCINLYSRVTCDCYGTGFVGTHCKDIDAGEVSLQGGEWVTLNLLDLLDTEFYSLTHRVALHFRTVAKEGIIYYAKEEYPVYNHVAISLKAGSLHVSVVFADQDRFDEVYTAIGTGLDDDRWHSLSVQLYKTEVVVTLDGEAERMQGTGRHSSFHVPRVAVFGGMQVTGSATLGLRSNKNLVGCLKQLYFNTISMLDKLDGTGETDFVTYSGGELITGCIDPSDSCLQFPRDGSFVTLDQSVVNKLVLALEFKTLKASCLLLHTDLSTVVGGGFMQVSLEGGQLEVRVIVSAPQPTPVKTLWIGQALSDNTWHTLDIYYSNGRMDVRLDGKSTLTSLDLALQFSSKFYLGFSPIIINIRRGFAGCMKNIMLNNELINPVEILHSPTSVGITLGTCDLVDMCQGHIKEEFQCQNEGMCVSEWSHIYCDCEEVFFEGRYCQFGKLQGTCAGLYHWGVSQSGVYYIAPTGKPLTVYCDMDQQLTGGVNSNGGTDVKTGVTIVNHNLKPQTLIRGKDLDDLKMLITYRSMDGPMLRKLVGASAYCEQKLTFTCSQSPLDFGINTWMVSPGSPKVVPVIAENNFNCDQGKEDVVRDTVTLTDPDQLPVTEIYAYKAWGNTSVILSPLYCYGAESQLDGYSLTFVTSSSYMTMPWLWEGGLLEFEFRGVQSDTLLLTQAHGSTDSQQRELRISLRNGQEVELYLPGSSTPFLAVTGSWLNDSAWHSIQLETSRGEARLIVDKQTFFLQLSVSEPMRTEVSAQLYIGGMPESDQSVYHLPGFVGCMRSILVEGQLYQPVKYLDNGVSDILSGCHSHCDSSPCQNNGLCVERWTHYYCQCHNPLAQSGLNCQMDLNTDPVSVEDGMLDFELPHSLSLQSLRIIFSFQTRERQVEVLRIVHQERIILSVNIENGTFITATLFGEEEESSVQIWMLGLCQGSWKQALVEISNSLLQMVVDDKTQVSSITGADTVTRPGGLRLLTGADYRGCLRGLQLNGEVFSLTQALQGKQGASLGCGDACAMTRDLCANAGQCVVETSGLTEPLCDCSLTGYAGHYCDRDIGGYFNGETVLVQWLQPFAGIVSEYLKVLLYFSSDVRNRQKMALIQLQSQPSTLDVTSVYLSEKCTLIAEMTAQDETVHLESSLSMCDAQPHQVTFTRTHRQLILMVDDEIVKRELPDSMQVREMPNLLVIGASHVPGTEHGAKPLYNFTGNLANVFVVSDQLVVSARPLDIAFGFSQSDLERVTVYGELQPATQSLVNHRQPHTTDLSRGSLGHSSASGMAGDLAPVEPRNAQTVPLTTQTAAAEDGDDGGIFHPALIFGICILVLLIIAIIIILVYVRHYRKKSKRWAPQDSKKDEEKGLLTDSQSSPSKEKPVEEEGGVQVPEVKMRPAGKQPGVADKKKSQLPGEEDDEATPMLLSMQPHLPDDNVELNNFQKQINKLPMIDDTVDESSLENEPAVPLSPHRKTPADEQEEAGQPQVDGVSEQSQERPLNGDTEPPNEEDSTDEPKEVSDMTEDKPPAPSGTSTPPYPAKVKMRQPPGVTADRLALTESQVLDMLDKNEGDHELPVSRDPAADTSFSSLPEDSQPPCLDLEIQADVHHRTMSFDSETALETPDTSTSQNPGLTNGLNEHKVNGNGSIPGDHQSSLHCSDRSLSRIPEECSSPDKDSNGYNGMAGQPELANGQHALNSHSKDSLKGNGPSYVIDSSLNEIHVDNTR